MARATNPSDASLSDDERIDLIRLCRVCGDLRGNGLKRPMVTLDIVGGSFHLPRPISTLLDPTASATQSERASTGRLRVAFEDRDLSPRTTSSKKLSSRLRRERSSACRDHRRAITHRVDRVANPIADAPVRDTSSNVLQGSAGRHALKSTDSVAPQTPAATKNVHAIAITKRRR